MNLPTADEVREALDGIEIAVADCRAALAEDEGCIDPDRTMTPFEELQAHVARIFPHRVSQPSATTLDQAITQEHQRIREALLGDGGALAWNPMGRALSISRESLGDALDRAFECSSQPSKGGLEEGRGCRDCGWDVGDLHAIDCEKSGLVKAADCGGSDQ